MLARLCRWLAQYRTALPGYRYEFPRDHFNHPDFQTEWWYYTGNREIRRRPSFRLRTDIFPRKASTAILQRRHLGRARPLSRSSRAERSRWRPASTTPNAPIARARASRELANRSAASGTAIGRFSGRTNEQSLQAIDEQFRIALHAALRKAARDPWRKWRQSESRRARPRFALYFSDATRSPVARIELAGQQFRSRRARPGWITNFSPINSSPNRGLGLAEHPARRPHGTDVVSHSPQRRFD